LPSWGGVSDLFVSRVVAFREGDFATAVDNVKQSGVELILGPKAAEGKNRITSKRRPMKDVRFDPDTERKTGFPDRGIGGQCETAG
jgi:hypothetical protein